MISAYIQIIVMLLGAFLLGMFVAWQYWRKKYQQLNDKYEQLQGSLHQLNESHSQLQEEYKKQQKEYQKLVEDAAETEEKLNKKIDALDKKVKSKDKKLKEETQKTETLQAEITVLDDELTSAHDELMALKNQPKKSSYYRYIDGKRYKAVTLREADEAVSGKGDGRISEEDCRKIFSTISDGKQYTPTEKATIRYLRENYKWTEKADHVFRHLVGSWAAHDHNVDEIVE